LHWANGFAVKFRKQNGAGQSCSAEKQRLHTTFLLRNGKFSVFFASLVMPWAARSYDYHQDENFGNGDGLKLQMTEWEKRFSERVTQDYIELSVD
jgi:hypothetical protein